MEHMWYIFTLNGPKIIVEQKVGYVEKSVAEDD